MPSARRTVSRSSSCRSTALATGSRQERQSTSLPPKVVAAGAQRDAVDERADPRGIAHEPSPQRQQRCHQDVVGQLFRAMGVVKAGLQVGPHAGPEERGQRILRRALSAGDRERQRGGLERVRECGKGGHGSTTFGPDAARLPF